jgi:hypothetical protein
MMTDKTQYLVKKEPYYQAQGNEVALYEAAYRNRLPVMVKGPTGCGKSRFVEYMAWKLGKPLITVACNEDMTARPGRPLTCSKPTAPAGWTARSPLLRASAPSATSMKSSRRARTPPWSSTRSPTTGAPCRWTRRAS